MALEISANSEVGRAVSVNTKHRNRQGRLVWNAEPMTGGGVVNKGWLRCLGRAKMGRVIQPRGNQQRRAMGANVSTV